MSETSIRKVWMTPELHEALGELAYRQRTTVSDILRDILSDITKNPQPRWLAKLADLDGPKTKSVSLIIDDAAWLAARDAAWPTRMSIAKLVRLHALHRLQAAGIAVAAAVA